MCCLLLAGCSHAIIMMAMPRVPLGLRSAARCGVHMTSSAPVRMHHAIVESDAHWMLSVQHGSRSVSTRLTKLNHVSCHNAVWCVVFFNIKGLQRSTAVRRGAAEVHRLHSTRT